MSEPEVLFERRGSVGIATLNRPAALNALNLCMIRDMLATLARWREDPGLASVVLRGAGGRAFCAGGDVKAVWRNRGDHPFMDEVYRLEYRLDHLLHSFPVPVVSLMDGIVMGGGCGLTMHTAHRIVTETTVLAMPETAIGLFPDVGGSLLFSRCSGHVGPFLALTGTRIGPADAISFGFADHFLSRASLDRLVEDLAEGARVQEAVQSAEPREPDGSPLDRAAIDDFFGGGSALQIVQSLEAASTAWARSRAAELRRMCPFSLELTLKAIERARGRTLAEVLATDLQVALHVMDRADYFEGVRALLIDRDDTPAWMPTRLEEVDGAEVDACFGPYGRDLWDPLETG